MRQSASVITLLVGSAAGAAYTLASTNVLPQGYGAGFYQGTANTSGKIPQALRYSDAGAYTSLTDRQAAYAPYGTWASVAYSSTNAVSTGFKMSAALAKTAPYTGTGAAASGGSGCPQCILGGGVWCSRTYAYQLSDAAQKYQWEQWPSDTNGTNAASYWFSGQPASAAAALAGALDYGACCQGQATSGSGKAFSSLMGGFGAASAADVATWTTSTDFTTPLVAGACPAIADSAASSWAGANLAVNEWKASFLTANT
jgi:hypothetical protein